MNSNKHNILVYSKCSVSFILYILTILVYPKCGDQCISWCSNYGTIKKLTAKTLIIHGKEVRVHDNIIQLKSGYKINILT